MRDDYGRKQRGQTSLEMALTCPLVFAIILGCLELGLAFNGYVTVVSAAREGARAGAVYLYDSEYSPTQNDQNRETGSGTDVPYTDNIRDTVAGSLGILKNTSPNFDRNADVTIAYVPTVGTLETRKGDLVSVRVTYHYTPLTQLLSSMPAITLTAEASARIE